MLTLQEAARSAQSAIQHCDQLAAISEYPNGILRQYLTEQHQAANQLTAEWMSQAGLQTWQDEVGNQWGRLPSAQPGAKRLLLGSHLDTVPDAGRYDGILGVMLAIEVCKLIREKGIKLPFHVDIVGFADEEGTRFATTLIGSHAIAGNFKPSWLQLIDKDGVSLATALEHFGCAPDQVKLAQINSNDLMAYLEVHIEQGPVLEANELSLGIVTAIAGAKRANITFTGHSAHAGTTPMNLRQDAVSGASEFIYTTEQYVKTLKNQEVATIGQVQAYPGATNVVAGSVKISLDARAQNQDDLDALTDNLQSLAKTICQQRNLNFDWQWTHDANAVQCAPELQDLFALSCQKHQIDYIKLPSGAGHDAMAVAAVCPVAMLFIKSPGGISHHPDEAVDITDVSKALTVFFTSVIDLESYYVSKE
ncbi:allantoate amidohydrolase [Gayadomonas joobiniege]|uniref:allantoate amidohydrolase n=1 Tax=Gayadomonas joobiniege TaxID=1234606 RepID=UPI00037F6424|nr:allantoate amidohydrolase [Gayadomonas joobiniege]